MDLFTAGQMLYEAGKGADKLFGYACPECGEKSWLNQDEVGETWFTGKKKIQCGNCNSVFKVKKES